MSTSKSAHRLKEIVGEIDEKLTVSERVTKIEELAGKDISVALNIVVFTEEDGKPAITHESGNAFLCENNRVK